MKVAIVYPIEFGDDGHVGGGERYAQELAHALAEVVDTRLVTFGLRRERRQDGRLRIEVYPRRWLVRGRLNNPFNPRFLNALRDVDVIHCLAWHVLPTDLAVLYGKLTGKQVIVTDQGGGADVSLTRILPMGRLVDRFLFVSRYAASRYPEFGRRARVIYGGADIEQFSPADLARKRQILFVGRLIPSKGIEQLIDAVEPDVPLLVIGRPYDAEYFDALKRRAAGRSVEFITDASDRDIVMAYRTSLVTVLPSWRQSELLGLVLLEIDGLWHARHLHGARTGVRGGGRRNHGVRRPGQGPGSTARDHREIPGRSRVVRSPREIGPLAGDRTVHLAGDGRTLSGRIWLAPFYPIRTRRLAGSTPNHVPGRSGS